MHPPSKTLPEKPPGYTGTMTPMLLQYWAVKRQYPDALLFYRMGDFYEMFFEDALVAAPILGVQLTSRDKNSDTPIPMCGVPHHAAMNYLQKLVAAGRPVALCEQMEAPGASKLVRREVVRVVTPGLVGDPDLLAVERANLLFAAEERDDGVHVACFDLLAQDVRASNAMPRAAFLDVLCEERPAELLTTAATARARWFAEIAERLPTLLVTVRDGYFRGTPARALESYLEETQKVKLDCFDRAAELRPTSVLRIDATSAQALEIVEGRSASSPTLWKTLDHAVTPMGRRLLKDWLLRPLRDRAALEARHDAVAALFASPSRARALLDALKPVGDMERLATKTQLGLASPRDLGLLGTMLGAVPHIASELTATNSTLFASLAQELEGPSDLAERLQSQLVESPPTNYREGGIFRDEAHPELAELRRATGDAKGLLLALETDERTRTGIPSLKVKYSRVFGYTIEVTNSHLSKVPSEYKRKQTIAGGERFVTERLADLEVRLATAETRLCALEEELFLALRRAVAEHGERLLRIAKALAATDVLLSFARHAAERGHVRPTFSDSGEFRVEMGRHPVLECWLGEGAFVPNSLDLSHGTCRTLILTGPNMGGKSTYLRQAALLCVLAQAGAFVPAKSAVLPIVDAVFTRIGSGDDLARGKSTFLVEMTEVARILEQATPQSLVVIDEVGRGTSTYDGLALAWAIVEHLHNRLGARTLFATHFHELVRLADRFDECTNAHVLVERWNDEIRFLHQVAPGPSDRSYGVEVARLAGLPAAVLRRAEGLCRDLEGEVFRQNAKNREGENMSEEAVSQQLSLFSKVPRAENRTGVGTAPIES